MIRAANIEDIEKINIMFKNVFNSDIKKDIYTKILVFEQKKILGFISYSIIYDRCELNYIGVLKEYQNNGIATKLMDYMINDTKNLKNISLEVSVDNEIALNLYKKYNFEIVATRKNYYSVNQNNSIKKVDAYLMLKRM